MDHDHILSLCSGIGGLDLGLHAGLRAAGRSPRTVGMVEREAFAVAILAKAMQGGRLDPAPIWLGDLRDLPLEDLPRVDWITGGYPCQPFSQAGRRLGEDDPRHLWPAILRIVDRVEPLGVFFENVAGHLTLGLDRVLRDLSGRGFRCAFGLYAAAEAGAPHRRERVFILGLANRDGRGLAELGARDDDDRGDARRRYPDRRDEAGAGEGLADADRDPRGPREPRRDSGALSGAGRGLRAGSREGEAGEEPRGRGPALADAQDDDRRSRVGDQEAGTWEDDERRRGPDLGGSSGGDGGPALADCGISRLEGLAGDVDRAGRETSGESRSTPPCGLRRGAWRPVLFADDCSGDRDDDLLVCPCGLDYLDCSLPGPTEDGVEYGYIDGALWGRRPLWPSRPGEDQADWEPPRTLEPRLGRDSDGLPDRVDRLRALGNAVVPAQAEIAFLDLWEALLSESRREDPC